jgi:excisionase family DNA binding protein
MRMLRESGFKRSDNSGRRSMIKDILTTSEMAKLLGVSVRTAQLLVEGGTLNSWKTPGGHRRVYRSDVLNMMAQQSKAADLHSARVLLLASAERQSMLTAALAAVGGALVEPHTDAFAAFFAMGMLTPAAVVVDLEDDGKNRLAFMQRFAATPALNRTKLIALGRLAPDSGGFVSSRLHATVTTPQELAHAVQTALQGYANPDAPLPVDPSFPIAANERQRLAALTQSGLLETGPEEAFDRLTWMAAYSLKAPVALMSLLTPTHQIFKSRQGLEMLDTPRSWAFCNHTILQNGIFTVGDLARDERFASNPAVMNDPHFRFYAGAPIYDSDGFALASLCVLDYEPRRLDTDQEHNLQILANVASAEIQSRATRRSMSNAHLAH